MKQEILYFVVVFLLFSSYAVFAQESETPTIISLGALNEKAKILPMPTYQNIRVRVTGNVNVQVKINLQKGKVVEANAVTGHPLLRKSAENAAMQTEFEPILKDFNTIYGTGILAYKIEDFTGKIIQNKNPKPILPVLTAGIVNGKATTFEKPEYPEQAKDFCVKGKVEVFALIQFWDGKVVSAKAISGDELLYEASEKAVLNSKFAGGNVNGNNYIFVIGKVIYNFDPFAKCFNVGIVNKKAISLPKPYINPDVKIKQETIVKVGIIIDETGKVIVAKVVSKIHPLLRSTFENAARQAKFQPTNDVGKIQIKAFIVYKLKQNGKVET